VGRIRSANGIFVAMILSKNKWIYVI